MTLYPVNLEQRFAATLKAIQTRLTKLESRTAAIDSGYPLAVLPGTIDPSYSGSGEPGVYINNSPTLTTTIWRLSSYTPVASDLVAVVPIGAMQAYLILGKLT